MLTYRPSAQALTYSAVEDGVTAWGAALARTQAELAEAAALLAAGLPPSPEPPQSDEAVIARMADTMEQRCAGSGACSESDLAAAGFTAAQITRFADRARAIAARREME
jgi:hypothetical protein